MLDMVLNSLCFMRNFLTLSPAPAPPPPPPSLLPFSFLLSSTTPIQIEQPLPFQPGTSFGAIPMGAAQPGLGSLGSGFLPRNIDIRIRTGNVLISSLRFSI